MLFQYPRKVLVYLAFMPQRTGLEVFDAHSPMEKNILSWRKEKRMISFGGKSGQQQQQNLRALCDLGGGGGGGGGMLRSRPSNDDSSHDKYISSHAGHRARTLTLGL